MLQTSSLGTTRYVLGASAHRLQPIAFGVHISKASATASTRGFSIVARHKNVGHSTNSPSTDQLPKGGPLSQSGQAIRNGRQRTVSSRRFSFSAKLPREYFPEANTPQIYETKAAWSHPVYTEEQMRDVVVAHRDTKNMSDRVALLFVRLLRFGLDFATGYNKHQVVAKAKEATDQGHKPFEMTARKYLIRNVFLESLAGVPGMVGGMLRHLHSMRRLKRDNGWIETLLEESYNERMHLLTFLKMYEPSWFMRTMVLGAQGVFFNGFFLAYLISPRTAHRFVGYLEEEAVITYTREIADIDAGKLPEWEQLDAPDIAVKYWNMPEGHRKMRDLLLYIRADEAKHREVNHTLGSLDQKNDPNPYVSDYKDEHKPHPTKGLEYLRPTGWERKDII